MIKIKIKQKDRKNKESKLIVKIVGVKDKVKQAYESIEKMMKELS